MLHPKLNCIKPVVLNLYKHAKTLRSFPNFCRTPFFPIVTESKNGLHVSVDLRRTPETAPSNPGTQKSGIEPRIRTQVLNPRGSIEPRLRTTGINLLR